MLLHKLKMFTPLFMMVIYLFFMVFFMEKYIYWTLIVLIVTTMLYRKDFINLHKYTKAEKERQKKGRVLNECLEFPMVSSSGLVFEIKSTGNIDRELDESIYSDS